MIEPAIFIILSVLDNTFVLFFGKENGYTKDADALSPEDGVNETLLDVKVAEYPSKGLLSCLNSLLSSRRRGGGCLLGESLPPIGQRYQDCQDSLSRQT